MLWSSAVEDDACYASRSLKKLYRERLRSVQSLSLSISDKHMTERLVWKQMCYVKDFSSPVCSLQNLTVMVHHHFIDVASEVFTQLTF